MRSEPGTSSEAASVIEEGPLATAAPFFSAMDKTMTKHVQLDNIQHKNLRVRLEYGAAYGTNVGTVLTFPTEFADVQREYAIFFRRDKNGDYYSVALLGFSPDENLYLDGDKWDSRYIPGMISRGPFVIGFQERQEGGE